MNVPFIDFSEQYQTIKGEVLQELEALFEQGAFILGPQVKHFEEAFASFCDTQYGVGVNSGTDALYMALSALGIGPEDEVILPTHTFIATALAVSYTGATPVFVDIKDDTYNIDPEQFKKAITPKTKAVMTVHIYGQAANMNEINLIAREHGIKVVEDAAQAHGARYDGKRVGSLGDVACFSFYPTKSLGAFGDGGMVVTNDEHIYNKMLMLRDYGRKGRYEHVLKGHNSRLDTVQAVILNAKLKKLDEWNAMRGQVADWYQEALADVADIVLPQVVEGRTHVYQTFALRIPRREKVMDAMKERGVTTLIHYPIPVHLQEAYQECGGKRGDFPVAEQVADDIVSLPFFPHMSREQVNHVSQVLKECLV